MNLQGMVSRCALVMLGAVLMCSCGSGGGGEEIAGATLSGTITQYDTEPMVETISAVEGATVSLKQSAVTKRSATTGASGYYLIEDIKPGTYDLEAEITPSFRWGECYTGQGYATLTPEYDLNGAGLTDLNPANFSLSNLQNGTYTITYGSIALASEDSVSLDFRVYGY